VAVLDVRMGLSPSAERCSRRDQQWLLCLVNMWHKQCHQLLTLLLLLLLQVCDSWRLH
jgi:hypothetical protein